MAKMQQPQKPSMPTTRSGSAWLPDKSFSSETNCPPVKHWAPRRRKIPSNEVVAPASTDLFEAIMLTKPTIATPSTMVAREIQWWAYYLRPRNISAMKAVMTTMKPRIIWYTLAAHIVRAMNIRVEPQMSKHAGIAINKGLILILSPGVGYMNFFPAYSPRQSTSPTNITAHWKYGWLNFSLFPSAVSTSVSSYSFMMTVLHVPKKSMRQNNPYN